MTKVISIQAARKLKEINEDELAYQAKIMSMSKMELLDEMIRFQERRSNVGELTLELMVQGKHLFRALEVHAESSELQILSRSYRRHLEIELGLYLEKHQVH